MEWIKKNKVLVGVLAGVAAVIVIVLIAVSVNFSVRNEGERQEQDLSALYNQSLNSLSTCVNQGSIAAQVTQQEYETIKETLVAAVSARYADDSTASGVLGGGQLISALQENYPQIDQRDWQNLQTLVVGCRDEFQGTQDHIQASAAAFNKWRVSDNLFTFAIKATFPSNELKVVTANGDTLYGQSAYDRITRVVTAEAASQAFESGNLPEQDLFGK